MGLFSSKSGYLGIDIGTSGIKVVEFVSSKNRPKLVTYGSIDFQEPGSITQPTFVPIIVESLKRIIREARTQSVQAVSAIPNYSVFSSIITLPAMNKKDLASAIHWEAKKFVPMPIDDMILDWKLLEIKTSENVEQTKHSPGNGAKKGSETPLTGSTRVLITAAPKTVVQKYVEVFQKVSIQLLSLETESFALERSLVGSDKTPTMIVDIGASTTSIIVTENGIPVLNRSIDVGGRTATHAIVNSLKVDIDRAEQFKRDIGFALDAQNGIPQTIEMSISPVVNEIKYGLDLYYSHPASRKVERVILAGGSAYLPRLPEYLSSLLSMKVFVGDPWARVVYPAELKPALDEIAPRFAGAVGLAMREIL